MKHYKKVLKILPEFPNVHNNIGLILMNDDNLSEAIKEVDTKEKNKPAIKKEIINIKIVLSIFFHQL